MIYFITNNTSYNTSIDRSLFTDITILDEIKGKELFYKLFSKKRILAIDLEATGLDPYLTTPLLYGIGTKSTQFMFDWTCNVTDIIKHIKKYNIVSLGHNLKYDIKLIEASTGILLDRLYDTMIAEQRIWMKSGYRFGYADLVERYLKKVIIKSVRNEFIGVDINKFKISPSHLYYLKGDLVDLFDIRKKQQQYIRKFKMEFLVYGIEFPLIPVIAKAELEGFVLDKVKWLERLKKEQDLLFETELELDKTLRELRDFKSFHQLYTKIDPKILLGGDKYNKIRIHNPEYEIFKPDGTTSLVNLFGENMTHSDVSRVKKKIRLYPNNVSWNAKKEIVYLFAALEEPLITPLEKYEIPQLDANGKLKGSINQYTIEEDFLLKYLLTKPNSIMKPLIELKIKHSKLDKAITTYGENFIQKLNPITGKLHTQFRQCNADTGRFQSGGGKQESDKPNFQNIPAKLEYRECFTVDIKRYAVMSADYSGAELAVMVSHAQDFDLLAINDSGDMHSFMATRCWRNIFKYRAKQLQSLFTKVPKAKTPELQQDYENNVKLYRTYEITKKDTALRNAFKPMTFEKLIC